MASKLFSTVGLALCLMGCAVGPNFKAPDAPNIDTYLDIPTPTQTVKSPGEAGQGQNLLLGYGIPEKWWEAFESPELNQLVEIGIANSPNMVAAQAALKQAKATYFAQIGSSLLPAFNAVVGGQREKFSFETFGEDVNDPNSIFNLYNAQVNVAYTLDIFGGARREIEALRAKIDYQQFEMEATYLTLVANIVTTALTEASLRAQIAATQELIAAQAKQTKIVQAQFEVGGAAKSDVLTQKTQLAQSEAQLPPLEKSLAINRHLLAVLIGSLPSENQLPTFDLSCITMPTNIPLSMPSMLVRKRPDVRASEALLHQACAQIGVATANMLPQFVITGNYGWEGLSLNNLISPQNLVWDIGMQVTQPVFQGGSLFFKRKAAVLAFEQARAQYKQVALQAFQDVADTLRALEIDAQTLKAQSVAEASALEALKLTESQYKLGAVPYLNLLNAQHQYQLTVISRVQAEGVRYTDTAALFQALGGGWWNCESQNA